MTSDRWRQVEAICHAALERPADARPGFIADACVGDSSLASEVESLLAQEAAAHRFMTTPAAALVTALEIDRPNGALAGRRVGVYTMHSLLGVGGMGEVYRAHDETLGREVAIKVLPSAFTADPDRRARFEREARTLAKFNHPHIAAIYGFEEADGVRILVMELVEGETLAQRIASAGQNGVPVADTLLIARQIADALDAAHEMGFVHRDLKPANIKVTADGVVKLLDFGLAKAETAAGANHDLTEPGGGAILGTAAYMSPEQARGKTVDKRADIWAFGCVLYEMLTGRIAFGGETFSDTIAKILEREPDWSALTSGTPERIRDLLHRCLHKDVKRRLRDIGDARIEIDSIDTSTDRSATPVEVVSRRTMAWATWLVAAILIGLGVWFGRRPPTVASNPFSNAQFSRLTDWEGTESGAEISPDGKFVAFIADRDGQFDLWITQVGTGQFLNLTRNTAALSAPGPVLRTFGFSGDGAEIWFAQAGDASGPKWLVPITGGPPRPFLGQGPASPSWSPDDTRLAYFRNGDGDPLFIADRTSADAHRLLVDTPALFASGMHNHNPVWSADGQWLYFAHGPEPSDEMNLWRVRPTGGTPEQLTALQTSVNLLAPIDSRTVLYVARSDDRSGPWLWSLDVETKVSQRMTSGLERYSSVSASRDGRRVATTLTNSTATLWRVPLRDRQPAEADVEPFAVPSIRALAPRFGGTSVFYLSNHGARDGLWRFRNGMTSEVWNAAHDSLSEPAAVSRDGARVAIVIRQDKKLRLAVMAADGTNVRTLAPSIAIQSSGGQGSTDWSPDGNWLVAAGADADGAGLFKIPLEEGRAPVRLVMGEAVNPVWSPDGNRIVYGGAAVGGQVTLLAISPEGARLPFPDVRVRFGGAHRFLPNGSGLVYLPRAQSLDFWLLDFTTNTSRALTRLSDHGRLHTFDITPDGRFIVFDRSRENSDIVLIDVPK